MYLLDTNVISELKRLKPHGAVVASLTGVEANDLRICAVTLGEIQSGVELLTRDQDPKKADALEKWADLVAGSFNVLSMVWIVSRFGAEAN